ncbi:alpha/beta hydrolase [Myxococcota bacterium]
MSPYLDCLEIEPVQEPQSGTVIWLHGLGANGHDFEPIVPMLDQPRARFIFPHAPESPVTINMGMVMPSWYDIVTLEEVPGRENAEHILSSAQRIRELIARENERGVPTSDIVLGGFSQGGALSLYVALRYPESLRGIMALSSYLILADNLDSEAHRANRDTPVLCCHGTHDPLVGCNRGRGAHDAVHDLSPSRAIQWHEFPMGHEVCPAEIETIRGWFGERFGP